MSDLISEYKKSGIVSNRPRYSNFVCGDRIYFTGEEFNAIIDRGLLK